MATSSLQSYTSIPSPPAATVYADMCYGSNGNDGGACELTIGNNGQDASSGRITWDNTDDAFDSGDVAFAVTIPAGGGSPNPDTLAVNGAVTNPILYSLTTYGAISSVMVEVGVQINASVGITDLGVQFYKAGVLTDTLDLAAGLSVDTTASSNPVAAQILTVAPAAANNDSVVISGTLRMQAPSGTFPDVNDLFAQVFIQTSTKTIHHGGSPVQPAPPTQ